MKLFFFQQIQNLQQRKLGISRLESKIIYSPSFILVFLTVTRNRFSANLGIYNIILRWYEINNLKVSQLQFYWISDPASSCLDMTLLNGAMCLCEGGTHLNPATTTCFHLHLPPSVYTPGTAPEMWTSFFDKGLDFLKQLFRKVCGV